MEDESIAPNTYLQLISQYGQKVVPVHYMLQYCVLARLSVYTDWISCGAISLSSICVLFYIPTINYSMIALNYPCHKNTYYNKYSIYIQPCDSCLHDCAVRGTDAQAQRQPTTHRLPSHLHHAAPGCHELWRCQLSLHKKGRYNHGERQVGTVLKIECRAIWLWFGK